MTQILGFPGTHGDGIIGDLQEMFFDNGEG